MNFRKDPQLGIHILTCLGTIIRTAKTSSIYKHYGQDSLEDANIELNLYN